MVSPEDTSPGPREHAFVRRGCAALVRSGSPGPWEEPEEAKGPPQSLRERGPADPVISDLASRVWEPRLPLSGPRICGHVSSSPRKHGAPQGEAPSCSTPRRRTGTKRSPSQEGGAWVSLRTFTTPHGPLCHRGPRSGQKRANVSLAQVACPSWGPRSWLRRGCWSGAVQGGALGLGTGGTAQRLSPEDQGHLGSPGTAALSSSPFLSCPFPLTFRQPVTCCWLLFLT